MPIESLSPRRLALLLMILSIGSLVDLNRPLGSLHGEAYHHLARAAVCEIPLMEEPDFDVLHALVIYVHFRLQSTSSDSNNVAVPHVMVSPYIFGQQQGHRICLEPDGVCREASSGGEQFYSFLLGR